MGHLHVIIYSKIISELFTQGNMHKNYQFKQNMGSVTGQFGFESICVLYDFGHVI
jgi:hypothetical protein